MRCVMCCCTCLEDEKLICVDCRKRLRINENEILEKLKRKGYLDG